MPLHQQKALHLISINSFGKLILHSTAINYLLSLSNPISIISIAGPYRTGKSFLLNSLISSQKQSFQVGDTINQRTHGLWIWGKPLLAYNQQGKVSNVLVIDSQGFASVDSTHDKRVVTLALLLSNCFLYNSKGPIDKDSVFDLEFVIEVARIISKKKEQNQIQQSKCDFHWILRDFHLDLVNQLGTSINSTQYMQNCLLQASQRISEKTISTLKSHFPQRKCHCLIQPNLNGEQQRPQFIEQILKLKKSILKQNPIKSHNMSGQSFVKIIQSYVDAINDGQDIDRIFQEGYDCRVRLDCLEKLNQKLKKLQTETINNTTSNNIKDDQLDTQLHGIRKQLKSYYQQRMCSNKQIQVLDNDVNDILQQYHQQVSQNKFVTNPRISYQQQKSYSHHKPERGRVSIQVNAPLSKQNNRMSIYCAQYEQKKQNQTSAKKLTEETSTKKFHQETSTKKFHQESSTKKFRLETSTKKFCQETSTRKFNDETSCRNLGSQKFRQDRSQVMKIQQLQLQIHKNSLQTQNLQHYNNLLKNEISQLKQKYFQKQQQYTKLLQQTNAKSEQLHAQIQQLKQQNHEKDHSLKIIQSQLSKQLLLSSQKIDFLQKQLFEMDQQKEKTLSLQRIKFKHMKNELNQQIQQLKVKHNQEMDRIKQIYHKQQRNKTMKLIKTYNDDDQQMTIYQQLQQKIIEYQALVKQQQKSKLHIDNLTQQLSSQSLQNNQTIQSLHDQIQTLTKRVSSTQSNMISIYDKKLQSKQVYIQELEDKLKQLNQTIEWLKEERDEDIQELNQKHHYQIQQVLGVSQQLRITCQQNISRVDGLKKELQQKQSFLNQSHAQKQQLNNKCNQLKDQLQKQIRLYNQRQKHNFKDYSQKQQTLKLQLQAKSNELKQIYNELQQLKKKYQQVSLSHDLQQQTICQGQQNIQHLDEKCVRLQQQAYHMKLQNNRLQQSLQHVKQISQLTQYQNRRELSNLQQMIQSLNQDKQKYEEKIRQLNKNTIQNKQQIEVNYKDIIDRQNKKYQQAFKNHKNIQLKLNHICQDKIKDNIRLEQRAKGLQRELTYIKQQKQQLYQQYSQYKLNNDHKQTQLNETLRQNNKDIALLKHKLAFNQQLRQQQKCRILRMEQQFKQKQQAYTGTIQHLQSSSLQQKSSIKQNETKYLQQKSEWQSKQCLLNSQLSKLKHLLSIYHSDQQCTQQNLQQILSKQSQSQIKQHNLIQLYAQKLKVLREKNQAINKQLESKHKQIQLYHRRLSIIQNSYNQDKQLWELKKNKLQILLRQHNQTNNKQSLYNNNNVTSAKIMKNY